MTDSKKIIEFLLGYLTPEQWADAIRWFRSTENESEPKKVTELWKLIKEQELHYDLILEDEVKQILNELNE